MGDLDFAVESRALADLKAHPRNYRQHPAEQLAHIQASVAEHGLYRNIVIASDDVILAGHGVCQVLKVMGYERVPVVVIAEPSDSPQALRILAGDNLMDQLALDDDRALSELLRELADLGDLLGTGFDEMMLANLVKVSRPESEIPDDQAAADWVGMPEYTESGQASQLVVHFQTDAARADFLERLGLELDESAKGTWWPPKEREDLASLRFQ